LILNHSLKIVHAHLLLFQIRNSHIKLRLDAF